MKIRQSLQRLLGSAPPSPWPAELEKLLGFTMGSIASLRNLYAIARDVAAREIPGDVVECGVFNGGSAAALATGLRGAARQFWLYDSFAGMPPVSAADGPDAAQHVGKGVGSPAMAREAMALAGVTESALVVRPGWFAETFAEPLPERIALLHIDCDWHDSVLLTLRTFHDRVSEGGIIILDDFGHWEGAREAFYEFAFERGLKPLVERAGHTQLYWMKGRAHNRDARGRAGIALSP